MHPAKIAILALAVVSGGAASALAHDTSPIERTQSRQIQSIEEGRRNGTVTRREYRELMAEQDRIAASLRHAEADGRVTGREVRHLREAQRDSASHIAHERSDGQVNLWRRWKSRHGI